MYIAFGIANFILFQHPLIHETKNCQIRPHKINLGNDQNLKTPLKHIYSAFSVHMPAAGACSVFHGMLDAVASSVIVRQLNIEARKSRVDRRRHNYLDFPSIPLINN